MTSMKGTNNPMYGVHRFGESSPHYGHPHSQVSKDLMSKKAIERFKTEPNPMLGKKRPDLSARNNLMRGKTYEELYGEKRASIIRKKCASHLENHPLWQGGKSFEPYNIEFNEVLRERIRQRDDYTCQICSKKPKSLHVHHKDYDKLNCKEENLVSLCISCHTKTNFDRQNWKTFWRHQND